MRTRLSLVLTASLMGLAMGCDTNITAERPNTRVTVVDCDTNFGQYEPETVLRARGKVAEIEQGKVPTSTDQLGFDNDLGAEAGAEERWREQQRQENVLVGSASGDDMQARVPSDELTLTLRPGAPKSTDNR